MIKLPDGQSPSYAHSATDSDQPRQTTTTVLLCLKTVAARLGCSPRTVHRLVKAGRIKAVKLNSQTRIRESELQRFVEALPASSWGIKGVDR